MVLPVDPVVGVCARTWTVEILSYACADCWTAVSWSRCMITMTDDYDDSVRSVTGEQVDMAALGGPETHSRRFGTVHVVVDSEAEAWARARRITTLLTR